LQAGFIVAKVTDFWQSAQNSPTITRDYIGPFQYVNGVLTEISTDEGRWTPGGGYEYFIKDHLGNVRVAFGTGGIMQYADYDPWGLALPELSGGSSTNRLKYNGKEAITEVGASAYDYGARLYDAQIGRWGVPDPLAELSRRFSPFVYGNNNPVRFIDPDGMNVEDFGFLYDHYSRAGLDYDNVSRSELEAEGGPGPKPKPAGAPKSEQQQQAQLALGTAGTLGRSGASVIGEGLLGLGRFLTSAVGLVATLPFVVDGDTRKKENYMTLYRNVGENEYNSYLRKGLNFGVSSGSLDVKEFWMTPEGLTNWKESFLAKPYTIAIGIPTSIIGPNRLVQIKTLDDHPAAIVTQSNLNAFNRAKTTLYINKD
jgi:RHS repeat-associated protein